MQLSTGITLYLNFNYTLAPKTLQIYREHLERLQHALDDPPLVSIDHYALAGFMSSLRRKDGQPYSPAYLNQVHRTLHTFFEFCVTEGWIDKNPIARLKRPRVDAGPKPRLSLVQVRQLLNAVAETSLPRRNMAIVLLMLDCGLRRGEVVSLTVGDIFLEEKRIIVRDAKTRTAREVPLSEPAELALRKYRDARRRPRRVTEPFFLTGSGPNKGQPISARVIEEMMKRLKRRLGFPLYAHLLRHTFGNHFIRKGGLKHLQKILGHSSINTTAAFYTDPDFPDLLAQISVAAPSVQIKQKDEPRSKLRGA